MSSSCSSRYRLTNGRPCDNVAGQWMSRASSPSVNSRSSSNSKPLPRRRLAYAPPSPASTSRRTRSASNRAVSRSSGRDKLLLFIYFTQLQRRRDAPRHLHGAGETHRAHLHGAGETHRAISTAQARRTAPHLLLPNEFFPAGIEFQFDDGAFILHFFNRQAADMQAFLSRQP